jgi:nucleoside-diphosphate-sugar epimerase
MQRPNPKLSWAKQSVLPATVPPVWLAELFGPTKTRFSSEKAKKVLGWRPLVSLEEGQEKTKGWLESIGLL